MMMQTEMVLEIEGHRKGSTMQTEIVLEAEHRKE